MTRLPWLTFILVLGCGFIYLVDTQDWGLYNRSLVSQKWRFITASFSHYDLFHLASNSIVLLVLGSVFEKRCRLLQFSVLTLLVMFSSVLVLHFFLDEYVTYAGISCLNFALMGWFLCIEGERRPAAGIAALLLLVGYEFYVVVIEPGRGPDLTRPVWQLHLLSFAEGIGFYLVQKYGLKTYPGRLAVR